MKLLCIDDEGCRLIKSGCEYNGTLDTEQVYAIPVYFIFEAGEPYDKNRFIQLSDTYETELVNNETKKELV